MNRAGWRFWPRALGVAWPQVLAWLGAGLAALAPVHAAQAQVAIMVDAQRGGLPYMQPPESIEFLRPNATNAETVQTGRLGKWKKAIARPVRITAQYGYVGPADAPVSMIFTFNFRNSNAESGNMPLGRRNFDTCDGGQVRNLQNGAASNRLENLVPRAIDAYHLFLLCGSDPRMRQNREIVAAIYCSSVLGLREDFGIELDRAHFRRGLRLEAISDQSDCVTGLERGR